MKKTVVIGENEIPIISEAAAKKLLHGAEIIMPQFTRRPSDPVPASPPTDWDWIATKADIKALRELGCGLWADPYDDDWPLKGQLLLLFPGEWYTSIPAGFAVTDIFGNSKEFKPGITDDYIRCGKLSIGVLRPAPTKLSEERPADPVASTCLERDRRDNCNSHASGTTEVARAADEVGVTREKPGGGASAPPALSHMHTWSFWIYHRDRRIFRRCCETCPAVEEQANP